MTCTGRRMIFASLLSPNSTRSKNLSARPHASRKSAQTSDIDAIVNKSSGQLIYAATVIRFTQYPTASPRLSLRPARNRIIVCGSRNHCQCSNHQTFAASFLHASLPDYLVDKYRSGIYHVDVPRISTEMLTMPLRKMDNSCPRARHGRWGTLHFTVAQLFLVVIISNS